MAAVDKLKKIFHNEKLDSDDTKVPETYNQLIGSFNPKVKDGSNITQTVSDSFNTDKSVNINIICASIELTNHSLIKVRKLEIKGLMDLGNTSKALDAYVKLQTDLVGEALSVDDKFYLLNGIYNCKINLNVSEEELETIKSKLELLSDAEEYHKFIYLTAVRYFNNKDYWNTIRYCDIANSYYEEYKKSKILKIMAKGISQDYDYKTALEKLDEYIDRFKDNIRELSNVICAKADLAYILKHFDDAITYYTEANNIHNMIHYQLGMGMSYFYKATKDTNTKGYITFDRVDYDALLEAVIIFEDILELMKTNKDILTITRMMPYYLNALEMIDEPQKVIELTMNTEYIEGLESGEITRIIAHAEMRLGKNPVESSEEIDPTKKLKLELHWLMNKGKFNTVVKRIGSLMDTVFRDDEQMIAFYLISLIKTNEELFISTFEKYNKRGEEVKFKLIWIKHLENKGDVDGAKLKLDDLLKDDPNKIVINEAYRFYKRNSFVAAAFAITTAVMKNQYSVLRTDLPEFITSHFITLVESKDYEEVDRFYSQIDFSILNDKIKLQIEMEYLVTKGEVLEVAKKSMEYAELTNNNTFVLKGASFFIRGGAIDTGISILEDLINVENIKTSDAYILLAKAYVIKKDYKKAFDKAYQAKEIDKDHYKSESHRFFVSLSLRVNRVDDSVKYMSEFHEEYPKNQWIRPIKMIKYDDNGNESLDIKELENLIGDRTVYNQVRDSFFSYDIGLSTYMSVLNETKINYIFTEIRQRGKKIKIASGILAQINIDDKLIEDKILVDTLSLYVLIDANILDVLNKFDKVYVLYSTIEVIQNSLINSECSILREMLNIIHNTPNIEVIPISSSTIIENEWFLHETGHCLGYSSRYKLPYLSVDFNLKSSMKENSEYVIDISVLLRSLSVKDFQNRTIYSQYNNNLIKAGYTFIRFNAYEMYDSIVSLDTYDNIEDELAVYFNMSRFCEYESFIKVYNHFLIFIEREVEKDIYIRCVVAVFKYLNRYLGKTQYYYNKLVAIANSNTIKEPFFKTNNIVNEFLDYATYVEERLDIEFYRIIHQNINYRKLDNIINSIIKGIFAFFRRYRNQPEVFEELCDLMKTHIINLDSRYTDFLLDEMKKTSNK